MTEFKVGDIVRTTGPNNTGMMLYQIDSDIPNKFQISRISSSGNFLLVDVNNIDCCYWPPSSLELIDDKKSKTAKIITEKVWKDGVQCRKIIGWENILNASQLPDEYLVLDKMFYIQSFGNMYLRGFRDGFISIYKEDVFEEKSYQEILMFMRECGHKLYEINKKLREEEKKKKWSGTQVDEI